MSRRILIYHVGGIGDTLVALPAFRMLKANFSDAQMDLLNLSIVPDISHSRLYDNMDLFERKTFLKPASKFTLYTAFLKETIFRKYDALFCFSPDLPKSLAAFFRIKNGNRIHHCFPDKDFPGLPLTFGYLKKLELFGLKRPDFDLFRFPVTEKERKNAEDLQKTLPQLPLVAFGIGGNQDVCRWPIERYDKLTGKLLKKHAFYPVWLGGPQDRGTARELTARHGGIFLADTVCGPLRDTIAFLQLCRGYVGNDTGSLHLAASAGIPCIGICSAHDSPAEKWNAFSKNSISLRHNPDCAGCGKRTCPKASPAPCLLSVMVDEVLNAAEQIILLEELEK